MKNLQRELSESVSGRCRLVDIDLKRVDRNDRVVFWRLRPAGSGCRRVSPWICPNAAEEAFEVWNCGIEVVERAADLQLPIPSSGQLFEALC